MSLVNISSYSVANKDGKGEGGSTNINITSDVGFGKEIEIWGQSLSFSDPKDITGDFRMSGGSQMRIGGYFTAYNGAYEDQFVQFRPTGGLATNSDFLLKKTNLVSNYGRLGVSGDYTDKDGNVKENLLLVWLD
jgi:hypothetical protein